jgi:hypothetical protein
MVQADLKGKTVMIATTNPEVAGMDIGFALEQLGAKVIYSEQLLPLRPDYPIIGLFGGVSHPPITPENTARYISDLEAACSIVGHRVEQQNPKIDAVILHNMDIKQDSARNAAVNLTKRIKEKCPVIISDGCDSKVAIQPLQDAGARFFNSDALNFEPLAATVADIVAQHGKPGQRVGG